MAISKIPSAGFQDNVKFKNKIVNGDISVDQRNETSTINATGVTYNVDRFLGRGVSSAGVFTLVQDTTSPDDFINSIKATVTTADSSISSGSSYRLQTNIEGYNMSDMNWGSSSAHNAVLSFYVKSSVTGTFGGSIANGAFNRFRVFSYTINSADTWERKTISIPGDTSGTWSTDNSLSVRINWSLGAGSTYLGSTGSWGSSAKEGVTGQTNLIATNSSTFFLTGVQFEKNTAPSSFEFLPVDVNLQRCQRYYYTIPATNAGGGTAYILGGQYSDGGSITFTHPVSPMRAQPTYTYTSIRTTSGLANYQTKALFIIFMASVSPFIVGVKVDAEL